MKSEKFNAAADSDANSIRREKRITRVTLWGSVVNCLLSVGKILAGFVGHSAAMLADGVHSFSDLLSDIVVLVSIHISSKGRDKDHDFGHGKYETFATLVVAVLLLVVAGKLIADGVESAIAIIGGAQVQAPGWIALAAAFISIVSKEILYQVTAKIGREENSPATIANAWHHRSDSLSSIGSFLAIGAAMLLGQKWVILDPLASCAIGIMIIVVGVKMAVPSIQDLLEVSLPEDVENGIMNTITSVEGVVSAHNLKTRRNGPSVIMEAHVVVNPDDTVEKAHDICTKIEIALKKSLGSQTQISLHIEPSEDAD